MKIALSKKSTNFQSFLNLMKGFVGSGILGLPFAFKLSGLWMGLITMLILSIITTHCIFLLIESQTEIGIRRQEKENQSSNEKANEQIISNTDSQKGVDLSEDTSLLTVEEEVFETVEDNSLELTPTTFGEVGEAALSYVGRLIIECLLIFTQCGFCIAYLIFISTTMRDMFQDKFPFLKEWMYIFAAGLLILPFALIRNIKYLTPFSVISEIALVIGLILVVYFDFVSLNPDTVLGCLHDFPFHSFPIFLGLAIYSFEGIGLVLPIYNNMKNRSSGKFVVLVGMATYTLMMLGFGIIGYLSYGTKTHDVITKNMTAFPIPVYIVNACLIITLFFTYPIQLYPIPELFESYTNQFSKLNNFVVKALIRISLVAFTIVGAVLGQALGFGIILSFIGAIGGSSLAYTLPGLIHLKVFWKQSSLFWKIKDIALILFGTGCLLLSVSVNIYSIIMES